MSWWIGILCWRFWGRSFLWILLCGLWVICIGWAFMWIWWMLGGIQRRECHRLFHLGMAGVVIRRAFCVACLLRWCLRKWRFHRWRDSIVDWILLLVEGRVNFFIDLWFERILCRRCQLLLRLLIWWILRMWNGILLMLKILKFHLDSEGIFCFNRLRFEFLWSFLLRLWLACLKFKLLWLNLCRNTHRQFIGALFILLAFFHLLIKSMLQLFVFELLVNYELILKYLMNILMFASLPFTKEFIKFFHWVRQIVPIQSCWMYPVFGTILHSFYTLFFWSNWFY